MNSKNKNPLPLLLCFATGVVLCFAQSIWSTAKGETNIMLVYDSGHYLDSAKEMIAMVTGPGAQPGTKESLKLAQDLLLDGPVLPALGAFALLTIGRTFSLNDWQCLLFIQAFLHGLSIITVYLLAGKILGRGRWALGTTILWAISPQAMLATQRFLVENLASFLLPLLLIACNRLANFSQPHAGQAAVPAQSFKSFYLRLLPLSFICGLITALILFVKAGMAPAAFCVLGLTVLRSCIQKWGGKSDFSFALPNFLLISSAAFIAIAMVIAPWANYTATYLGKMDYIPQRIPVFNLFMGWDVANEGLSTLPVAPVNDTLEQEYQKSGKAPLAVLKLWQEQPQVCFTLAAVKVARLYNMPWNDFRRNVLFLSPKTQQILHQFLLILAAIGFCLMAIKKAPFILWLLLVMLVGHCVFVLFEAIPRYTYSSYPLLLILAAYGLQSFDFKGWTRHNKLAGGAIVFFILLMGNVRLLDFLPGYRALDPQIVFVLALAQLVLAIILLWRLPSVLPIDRSGDKKNRLHVAMVCLNLPLFIVAYCCLTYELAAAEWCARIGAGNTAERVVKLPPSFANASPANLEAPQSLLLIDAAKEITAAEIRLNGELLKSKAVNLYEFLPDRQEHFRFAEQLVSFMGRSTGDLRHWWAVVIPAGLVKANADNIIEVKPSGASGLKLYGQFSETTRAPGYMFTSPGKAFVANDSFDWRIGYLPSLAGDGGQSSLLARDGQRAKKAGTWRLFLFTTKDKNITRALENYSGNGGQGQQSVLY